MRPSLTVLHLVREWAKTRPAPEFTLWAMGDPIYEKSDPRIRQNDPTPARIQAAQDYPAQEGPNPDKFARLQSSGQRGPVPYGICLGPSSRRR